MSPITYVDESGLFDYKNLSMPRGLRLVGGILLPLPWVDAETVSKKAIRNGLERVGAGWWHEAIHARDFRHAPKLARAFRYQANLPSQLAALASCVHTDDDAGLPEGRKLKEWGERVLMELRRVVGELVQQQGGLVLAISEYGEHPGTRGSRFESRYLPMLHSLMETCLLRTRMADKQATQLDAVIATRKEETPPGVDFQAWSSALERLFVASNKNPVSNSTVTPVFEPAHKLSGLQMADIAVHALGPGGQQDTLPKAHIVEKRTLEATAENQHGISNPGIAFVRADKTGLMTAFTKLTDLAYKEPILFVANPRPHLGELHGDALSIAHLDFGIDEPVFGPQTGIGSLLSFQENRIVGIHEYVGIEEDLIGHANPRGSR